MLKLTIGAIDPGFRDLIYFVGLIPISILKSIKWSFYMKKHKRRRRDLLPEAPPTYKKRKTKNKKKGEKKPNSNFTEP